MAEEYVDIINENDEVIGKEKGSIATEKNLMRRVVHILLFNSKNELLLQKRAKNMKLYPSMYTSSASGGVMSGESYEQAAARELKEELGISANLSFFSKIPQKTSTRNVLCTIFVGRFDGNFTIDKKEVELVKFFSIDSIKQMLKVTPAQFTPNFISVFEEYSKKSDLKNIFFALIDTCEKSLKYDPWSTNRGVNGYCDLTLKETIEVKEAIAKGDVEHIKLELGDVLLNWIHLSLLAKEKFNISLNDIMHEADSKIKRRKPYILENKAVSEEEALKIWNKVKEEEKSGKLMQDKLKSSKFKK